MNASLVVGEQGALEGNLASVDAVKALADSKGCTVGQIALAFLHAQVRRHRRRFERILHLD
jgi:aryl-alcohol dehydrogenase-like predicted oxidoreductase